jgi:hypothetical protein
MSSVCLTNDTGYKLHHGKIFNTGFFVESYHAYCLKTADLMDLEKVTTSKEIDVSASSTSTAQTEQTTNMQADNTIALRLHRKTLRTYVYGIRLV